MLEELPERLGPPDGSKDGRHAEIDAGADIIVMHGGALPARLSRFIAAGLSFTTCW